MKEDSWLICITGGIGAGKSIVSRILRQLGHSVYDCDYEAKMIMDNSQSIIDTLTGKYGSNVISEGRIDRKTLGRIIFSNTADRLWLNEIVHKAVREDILFRAANSQGHPFFVETAIPFTAGMMDMCTCFWLVIAEQSRRIERIKKRNALSDKDIIARLESQQKEFDNLPQSRTFVIENNDSVALLPQINSLLVNAGI